MFCRQCGSQNEPSSPFCANCGAVLSAPSARFENSPVVTAVAVPASPRVSPTPPASAISQTVASISATSPFARGAYAILREKGWVLWEVCVWRSDVCFGELLVNSR
jgi:hypothetical protein